MSVHLSANHLPANHLPANHDPANHLPASHLSASQDNTFKNTLSALIFFCWLKRAHVYLRHEQPGCVLNQHCKSMSPDIIMKNTFCYLSQDGFTAKRTTLTHCVHTVFTFF
jgi:hypothetical protein